MVSVVVEYDEVEYIGLENYRELSSVKVDGRELPSIEAIAELPIEEWFKPRNGYWNWTALMDYVFEYTSDYEAYMDSDERSLEEMWISFKKNIKRWAKELPELEPCYFNPCDWKGLMEEIFDFLGEKEVDLDFDFHGPEESRITFEKSIKKWKFVKQNMDLAQNAAACNLHKKAMEYYKIAGGSAGNNKEAQLKVAEYYWKNAKKEYTFLEEDPESLFSNAVTWYGKAAEQDSPEAQIQLYKILQEGCQRYEEETVKWLQTAAQQGDAYAWNALGCHYERGEGVERDYGKAAKCFHKAAEQGDAEAQYNLGRCYENGLGVELDYGKAAEWYDKAAESGYAKALRSLGKCYSLGIGVEQDYGKMLECYNKAAVLGDAEAQLDLGLLYKDGKGVERDDVKALRWFYWAAEQGNAEAQNNLGECFYYGKGVPDNDYQKAFRWFFKAAEQGNAHALCNLGSSYFSNRHTPLKDREEAIRYLRRAADLGDAHAQYCLGCHESNNDVAYQWYQKAAYLGHEKARQELRKLKKYL